MQLQKHKRGIIDLGSNSVRFVIFTLTESGKYKEELNIKRTARLCLHIDHEKNITSKGLEKIIEIMGEFKRVATFYQVKDVQCIATAVLREATNQKYILKEIKKAFKITVEVLTGVQEAYYGYLGVVNSCALNDGITIDIGGGSTEITLFENRELKYSHSFSFGTLTLTKDFIKEKKPTKKEMNRLSTYLSGHFSQQPWLVAANHPVIGIGGAARNVSKIYAQSKPLTSFNNEQLKMKREDIMSIGAYLCSISLRKRKKIAGLSKDRADIIIPGVEAIYQLMQVAQSSSFMASSQGLREGLCYNNQSYNYTKAK